MRYGKTILAALVVLFAASSCSEKMAPTSSSSQTTSYNPVSSTNQTTAPSNNGAAKVESMPVGTMQKGGNAKAIQPTVKE